MNNYFAFNDNVILVKGYKRALIQDLNKGRIFSINEDSKIILEQLLQGKSINEVVNNEKDIIHLKLRILEILPMKKELQGFIVKKRN